MRSLCVLLICSAPAFAHDTWVETNTSLLRTGDAVFIDLRLGNHGNEHRDYKLASKVDLATCTLEVKTPDGKRYDLKPELVDVGYAPKEGYWATKFASVTPGMHVVSHTFDSVVNHGKPVRSIKSGKAFFVLSESLDRVPYDNPGFDQPLDHPFELIPFVNPVTPMGPEQPIVVKLLFMGKPVEGAKVSFIPQLESLNEGFDERYERTTNKAGTAAFTPKTGDRYLVVAHHTTNEAGDGYTETAYAATLFVFVPELCPCCE